ncbi:MAG: hypothetical protein GTN65_00220 [Armatimonadetes bacterium]|nr:hypothetical protein [Armatimonadota bacterium]NIO95548.1 hypothetical protein [Armatimonadota bacterium]
MRAIPARHLKIGGREEFTETAAFELMDGVVITVNSLPFGFDEKMQKALPDPVPPMRPKTDGMGNPIYRDRARKLQETEPDLESAAFKEAEKAQSRRQSAFIIYHGTRLDKSMEWEAEDDGKKPEKFYQAVYDELVAASIGAGRILRLIQAIMTLSNMSKERMDRVADTFLSAAQGAD